MIFNSIFLPFNSAFKRYWKLWWTKSIYWRKYGSWKWIKFFIENKNKKFKFYIKKNIFNPNFFLTDLTLKYISAYRPSSANNHITVKLKVTTTCSILTDEGKRIQVGRSYRFLGIKFFNIGLRCEIFIFIQDIKVFFLPFFCNFEFVTLERNSSTPPRHHH